ncbi:uncharacterized protein LOC101215292 [Cucumis sativus]|uniref:Binding protein n=1 Tax=Cucumis sativus TaxID=3659 RepID=A0A0A0KRT2_CUCSA|nr:uncharacterized protein LOC101215292 [Cucumis sativus]KGN51107.1 hypothetical protein Csa_007916 [Cucumis sativus]
MASVSSSCLSSLNPIISSTKHSLFISRISSNKPFPSKSLKFSSSPNPPNPETPPPNSPETVSDAAPPPLDPVKLAFERAKAYKKLSKSGSNLNVELKPGVGSEGNSVQTGKSGVLSFDGADEQRKMQGGVRVAVESANEVKGEAKVVTDGTKGGVINTNEGLNDRDGGNLGNKQKGDKKGELSISSIDFIGLGFADKKKSRGLPAGLVPISDPFSVEDLPEVEIIVGDSSKFDDATVSEIKPTQEDDSDFYKPKVSTWGVFPRPGNISKTFGGGRTIRPGDVLETDEEKAVKEARTKELIAAYKKKFGLTIDAKLKSECEMALEEGDSLMNDGKLKEALPYYETIMEKVNFQSELHGLAALQWSICQDSLSRPDVAREMYEKLKSHPNPRVSKKARQFMFSFQAMEMMKVTTSSSFLSNDSSYRNYFEAFLDNKLNYSADESGIGEGVLNQSLPYVIFLLSPILLVLFAAVQKRI